MAVLYRSTNTRRSTMLDEIGISVVDLLIKTGLCKTKSEARRSIEQGGVRLHDFRVTDPLARLVLVENKFKLVQRDA